MLVSTLVLSFAILVTALPGRSSPPKHYSPNATSGVPLDSVLVFDPPQNYTIPRTLYARTLQLKECGTLLATWENYGPNDNTFPHFPIYQSTDGGLTWSERTKVYDQINGWGLRYQPFLYQLECPIGGYPAGTVLLAGSSIPDDLSQTQLELYASSDNAHTFHFVAHVARGGVALPNNGETPVWEPFLMEYQGNLVYYYSDQRDPGAGQKLVHQVTSDLVTYGPVVDDVKYGTYDWRPGMTSISHLPNGSYILTYEFYGAVEEAFAVYYRLSESPLTFNQAGYGQVIRATDGKLPVGSPYNVWTPAGGENGTILVSCGGDEGLWVSKDLTATWTYGNTTEKTSYSRSLLVEQDEKTILIVGAGVLSGTHNNVTASTVGVAKLLGRAGIGESMME
ncbi:glycoside hydrolase family 93 protein [Dothistroma septosporum NZE10]|uniref:Glycoside hydrolase family 93 protein n=1 Tax=Dothistroma septosporum (strain NZE10 / CBS 128990) TaxID=675120 RepID=N1PJ75_DOTSN|nr:glycoside hydrolase family 93 protein [Dothistroma septosporum NZE10]